jgi:hypothetical protein
MRRILSALALCVLVAANSEPASAEITYPWCAQYNRDGARNCGFWTYEQCMAAISGIGGYCETNTVYRAPQPGMIPPPSGPPGRYGY